MLALEIPLVAYSGATLERFGARVLLGVGAFAGGVRWLVCGFATDLTWVWPVQLLHGVVVAGLVGLALLDSDRGSRRTSATEGAPFGQTVHPGDGVFKILR